MTVPRWRGIGSSAVLATVLAAVSAAAADRDTTIRVHVRAAESAPASIGESVRDVQGALREGVTSPRLRDAPLSDADLVIVLGDRRTGIPPVHARGSDVEAARLFYSLSGTVIDATRVPHPVVARGVVWRTAAADFVRQVVAHARAREHTLLRARPDWPQVGFEFEPLTKELERGLGAKGGEAVVTAVAAAGPAVQAGLHAGDALVRLGDRKLESAGELARALYAGSPGDSFRIEVVQKGARRTVTLTLP